MVQCLFLRTNEIKQFFVFNCVLKSFLLNVCPIIRTVKTEAWFLKANCRDFLGSMDLNKVRWVCSLAHFCNSHKITGTCRSLLGPPQICKLSSIWCHSRSPQHMNQPSMFFFPEKKKKLFAIVSGQLDRKCQCNCVMSGEAHTSLASKKVCRAVRIAKF